jgi:hypothetical protein
MGNFSRDSFQDTKNALNELLGLVTPGAPGVRNYVGVRMQQAVPVLDADWNEEADIRRLELEYILAQAIGNGVPASSDGFKISPLSLPNNFSINAGALFAAGWLVYNRQTVTYDAQPYSSSPGLAPPLPVLQPPATPTTYLVYLDAWEFEVNSNDDVNLVDNRIGVETCVRLERAWLVRMESIAANANPLDPATIPNRQPLHRYYPLAVVNRQPIPQIGPGMIADLRRTTLSLDALTHAPLRVYDPILDQRLESLRLGLVFRSNLDVLQAVLKNNPEVFVYTTQAVDTAQAMSALQDVRAAATSFEQQAKTGLLYREAAFAAMQSFFNVQSAMVSIITPFATAGVAVGFTPTFLNVYNTNLMGSAANDPASMNFALKAGDLLGAAMAQERLNQDLGQPADILPQGNLLLSVAGVTPNTPVAPNTVFQLTLQLVSLVASVAGSEDILLIASAGDGWSANFQTTGKAEQTVTVTNMTSQLVVLNVSAAPGAAPTNLLLTARPVRRQQLVDRNAPIPLAIGQVILSGTPIIVTLSYGGPTLQPGNTLSVARAVMFGGVTLPFALLNLSSSAESYQVTATAQGTATGWQAPTPANLPPLAPNGNRTANLTFKTTDQNNAVTPVTYLVQVVRVTGGVSQPQTNTNFNITFQLA